MCLSTCARIAIPLISLFGPAAAWGWPGITRQAQFARVERLLDEIEIDTTTLDEKLTLEKLLTSLARSLPKDSGLTIDFDRGALGDDAAKLAALQIHIRRFGTISLQSVLQDALAQAPTRFDVDYALRPTGIVLTRPRLAACTKNYEIGEALRVDGRHLSDKVGGSGRMTTVRLAEFLTLNAGLRPWETIDVLNGRRLSVYATPSRQHALATLVGSMTRLADLGVFMNARLYEVDRDFFLTTVAPGIAVKKGEPAPVAIRIEKPLLDKVLKQTLIQESEDTKLEPGRKVVFLARERVFPDVGPTGISISVRPEVSPDRRHLRLQLNQAVAELVRPNGVKGPDVPAEEPTLRKTTLAGTVETRDGEAFLMPIDFRPPSKEGSAKVWVLVARPLIWIEAEERERGGNSKPRDVWNGTEWDDVAREMKPRPKPLPATEDAKAILQAVLSDLLTSKDIADSRKFYGTEADRTILLSNTGHCEWPEGFRPDLHGYNLVTSRPGPFAPRSKRNRVLGVRLDRFEPDAKPMGPFNTSIVVCLFNAGGSANGAVIGGCFVFYVPKRVDNKWVVEFTGLEDP